jgi:hypothetical protein
MGGDDSQKLMPWRGIHSSLGRCKPPAHCKIDTLAQRRLTRLEGRATLTCKPWLLDRADGING